MDGQRKYRIDIYLLIQIEKQIDTYLYRQRNRYIIISMARENIEQIEILIQIENLRNRYIIILIARENIEQIDTYIDREIDT